MTIPEEIPDELEEGGLGAVVAFMLEQGFSREEHGCDPGPWRQKDYRAGSSTCFGVSYNTLRSILDNQVVVEQTVRAVVNSLLRSLPEKDAIRRKWLDFAVNQPQVKKTYSSAWSTKRSPNETSRLVSVDGVWVYILRRHNSEKFDLANDADFIVGIFQWQEYSISTAYNYEFIKDRGELIRHGNWTASDCGIGVSSFFIPYRTEYFNSVTREGGVSGIIYAKYDGLQTTRTGRMAFRGTYHDTDTGRIEDGGEFYAERFSKSVDRPVELNTEIARALSEAF